MAGKRGNGEGSIYRMQDGRWRGAYHDLEGKRRVVSGKTRAEAASKLAAAIRDRDRGINQPAEKETVKGFLERWLPDVCKGSVRPNTYAGYERTLRLHVIPNLGKIRLARLAPQDLALLYRKLQEGGLSPRSVQLTHAVLHRALDQALRWNLVARNPADLVDIPRVQREEVRALSSEQCQALLKGSQGDPLHALFAVAVLGGLRSGELLGLKWEDVDFERGTVHVRRQLTRTDGGFVFSEPKTTKGRRSVTLPTMAMQALRQHRATQAEARLKAVAWEDNGLVFCTHLGTPLERQNVHRRHWKPLLERLELPDIRFHDLRHSSATLLLKLGEHPKVVQERLGHSTIGVTMDIYSHVMPDMQAAASAKLETLFPAADA